MRITYVHFCKTFTVLHCGQVHQCVHLKAQIFKLTCSTEKKIAIETQTPVNINVINGHLDGTMGLISHRNFTLHELQEMLLYSQIISRRIAYDIFHHFCKQCPYRSSLERYMMSSDNECNRITESVKQLIGREAQSGA
ncbi:hypothetical protein T4A_13709 [Trichinella pseudospiralis]|uniref:Uncharacterized protein n=1 Tax=Trichinella pseudospiralis TaxID=6337 RepID=A0A0V1ED40_TRIPS|nr:hypothetical protein T4A_13709 [Trichinella pseudospiralis]